MKTNVTDCPRKGSAKYCIRRGMTTLELLITVSLIAVLAALIIGGMMVGLQGSEVGRTRAILATCEGVLDEMVTSGSMFNAKPLNHFSDNGKNAAGDPLEQGEYDWENRKCNPTVPNSTESAAELWVSDLDDTNKQQLLYNERFVWAAMQGKTSREMLLILGLQNGDIDNKGSLGDTADASNNCKGFLEVLDAWKVPILYIKPHYDDDGDPHQSHAFLAQHPEPFFVSAGADGFFGDIRASKNTEEYKQSLDNIYSFNLEGLGHE